MKPSPAISTIGTGALVLGMAIAMSPSALAATGPAPQNPAEPAEADTMLEALERDLDLSTTEASELMSAQDEAFEVDAEAVEAAGDSYAGSLFDTDTHELTVLLTDTEATAAVEATGAETTVVTHGPDALTEIIDDLDAAGAPEGVVGWYPDAESDTVVIEATDPTEAESLVESTGVDASAVEIQSTDQTPELYADIIGGLAYTINNSSRCSVGFAATNSSGQPGFVTAGHCGSVGSSVSIGNGRGVFERSIFPGNDAAFVRGTSNFTLTNLVSRYNGTYQTVRGSSRAPIGSAICRSGSTTGWYCGTIQARGQTVNYPQGTVRDLTRTNVCAEPGDSGGSFISGTQAQGVTSGGSGNCSFGGTTYYQEVTPMLNSWNLSLRTS